MQLRDDCNKPSKQLSGGQKRKLCVCIALIGNPSVVILDEASMSDIFFKYFRLYCIYFSLAILEWRRCTFKTRDMGPASKI